MVSGLVEFYGVYGRYEYQVHLAQVCIFLSGAVRGEGTKINNKGKKPGG